MTKKTLAILKKYWQLSAAALVVIVSLALQLSGMVWLTHWILGVGAVVLSIPVMVSLWQDFRTGSYGLDILTLTAIYTSVMLNQGWAAIVVVSMLGISDVLEDFADHKAHAELQNLLQHAPTQAHVLRGRKLLDITAKDIQAGDKLLIKAGEVVPVDAMIIEGSASFDESLLTSVTVPVQKSVNDQILSSSVVSGSNVTVKALRSAADSQYEQIVKLVRNANATQALFVRLADRFSVPFTIAAYIIAGSAWFIGHQAIRFLEVIIVATPCPLLLAAPIALVSGMSRASRHGIIIKTGLALEQFADVETVAFDKTGTLTEGKLQVDQITAVKPYTQNEILGLAASLEQASAHTLAQAIVACAVDRHYSYAKAKHVQEFPGRGVRAVLHGKEVLVGQASFLEEHSVALGRAKTAVKQTTAYVAVNGAVVGTISFKDEPRPETKNTLSRLRTFGVKRLLLLTGDTQTVAETVAAKIGINEVLAELSPGQKLHALEKLEHRPVAFVGDGVNDAPALTAVDVGIALGARGSTAASDSADIVILPDDISYVGTAMAIARRTFAIAKQSILVGILLTIGLMLAFSTGHFRPLLGAFLQELVVMFVIWSALRAHRSRKSN